jgi:hypothetical protein
LILVTPSDLVEIKKQSLPRSTRLINGICFTRGNAITYVEGNQKGESENASMDRCAKAPPLILQPATDGPRGGLNPATLGKIDNHKQEPWKLPLSQFIEQLYFARFGKTTPDNVVSIEERCRLEAAKREVRRAAAKRERAMDST